jgi:predicted RNA binding protein YcfA (HicA-like mRNA interferase family)
MGQLAGFNHREVVKRLKELGLEFHRQAARSHEIWFNAALNRYTTIPNHPGLDTNVVVSALVWGGTSYKLLRSATAGDIELVTSPVLLAELRRVLAREPLANHFSSSGHRWSTP